MIPQAIVPALLALPRWAYWLAAATALCGAFLIWDYFDDRAAVEADRAASQAQSAKAALEAERAANRADAPRQAKNQADSQSTQESIDDAVRSHPEETARASGPATRAAADSLRRRQANQHPSSD